MRVVLDTCAIIWAINEPERLSKKCRALLSESHTVVLVSPISSAELACSVERNKVKLDRHWRTWFRHFINENGWQVVPIDLELTEEAYSLPPPFHADPADRLIVATARVKQAIVVTTDSKILNYPHIDSLS